MLSGIDANASSIEVKVDIAGHSLQVSDNGDGITYTDMEHVGVRYSTSKCSTLQDLGRIRTYGFRGEAIAAMTEMSLVDIVSYPRGQKHIYSTIFRGGERLYCGRTGKRPRFNHGTTVSYPVRQNYWSEASVSKLDLELEKVRRAVEILALISPRVSFTVIDMAKGAKVMTCRKADSQLNRITAVLGQALSSSLAFVKSIDDPAYSFSGYISTVAHYNRLYQFIYLNNRPINSESLNRAITQLFQQSSFSKDSLQYNEDLRRSKDRYPVYVLMLKCLPCEYDICVDPSKVTVEFERKSRAKPCIGNAGDSLGRISRVKTSRPSKAAKPLQHSSVSDGDNIHHEDIDIEDDLEFELDVDWMAAMLEDDFVSSEVEYNRQSDGGIMLPDSMSERTSLPHVTGPRSRPFNAGTSGIWAQDALRKWVNPVFPTPPNHIPALKTWNLDGLAQGENGHGQSIEKS
ncbi:DNA mismatch repair protein, partial [Mortierella sp. AD010]